MEHLGLGLSAQSTDSDTTLSMALLLLSSGGDEEAEQEQLPKATWKAPDWSTDLPSCLTTAIFKRTRTRSHEPTGIAIPCVAISLDVSKAFNTRTPHCSALPPCPFWEQPSPPSVPGQVCVQYVSMALSRLSGFQGGVQRPAVPTQKYYQTASEIK